MTRVLSDNIKVSLSRSGSSIVKGQRERVVCHRDIDPAAHGNWSSDTFGGTIFFFLLWPLNWDRKRRMMSKNALFTCLITLTAIVPTSRPSSKNLKKTREELEPEVSNGVELFKTAVRLVSESMPTSNRQKNLFEKWRPSGKEKQQEPIDYMLIRSLLPYDG